MPLIVDRRAPQPVAPVVVTGSDGILTVRVDTVHAGALLVAHLPAAAPWSTAVAVRFERLDPTSSTGVPVRSGDVANVLGAYAVAYDDEAPLGVGVSWRAVPVDAAGVAGTPSVVVATQLPDPVGRKDLWIKSLDDPGLSMRVQVEDWREISRAGRVQTSQIDDDPYPQITWRPRAAPTSSPVLITTTLAEAAALDQLLDSGVLLWQTRPAYGRPDRYVLVDDTGQALNGKAFQPTRRWTVSLIDQRRPSTEGAVLRLPGRSFADRAAAYPTFASVPARTFLQALTG